MEVGNQVHFQMIGGMTGRVLGRMRGQVTHCLKSEDGVQLTIESDEGESLCFKQEEGMSFWQMLYADELGHLAPLPHANSYTITMA